MLDRLPILATIFRAIGAVLGNFGTILKASMMPLLALMVLDTVRTEFGGSMLVWALIWVLEWPFLVLIAVAVHRTVLLGPESLSNPWSLFWSQRESSFMILMVILNILFFFAVLAAMLVAWMLPETWMAVLAVAIFVLWFAGRCSMVLPAAALDKNMDYSNSWYLTSGNGLQLVIVLGAPALLWFGLFQLVLMIDTVLLAVIASVLAAIFSMAVGIATLSVSYDFLVKEARRT